MYELAVLYIINSHLTVKMVSIYIYIYIAINEPFPKKKKLRLHALSKSEIKSPSGM